MTIISSEISVSSSLSLHNQTAHEIPHCNPFPTAQPSLPPTGSYGNSAVRPTNCGLGISPVRRRTKRSRPPTLLLRSIDEEATSSEYDVEGLDLGAESPRSNNSTTNLLEHAAYVKQWAETGLSVPRVLERTSSWSSFGKRRHRPDSAKEDDRDCGICFEYAVRPCRTLCCGKIFCTEHLADWLHGPNAEGRCPNCENACSLEGSTLSLSSPLFISTSQSPPGKRHAPLPANHGVFQPSPLAVVQPRSNHTLEDQQTSVFKPPTHSTSTSLSSDRDHTISSNDEDPEKHPYPHPYMKGGLAQLGSASASAMNLSSTTPFSSSWGALSRLMSIITFLMFIYKLLS